MSVVTPLEPLQQSLEGTLLIEASAGTGKTYTITTLVLRLVIEEGLLVRQILVVTFTDAATEELRGRVRERLQEALEAFQRGHSEDPVLRALLEKQGGELDVARRRLLQALHGFDAAAIFTIHGFCRRLLQEQSLETDSLHSVELIEDNQERVQQIVEDYWRKNVYTTSPMFVRYLLSRSLSPDALVPLVKQHVGNPFVTAIPDRSEGPSLTALEESLRLTYEEAREAWLGRSEEITASLLAAAPGMKKNQYSEEKIQNYAKELSAFFRGRHPRVKASETFKYWLPATLKKGTRKGNTTPEHPFFGLCERFEEARTQLSEQFARRWIDLKLDLFATVKVELERLEREEGELSFDSLLLKVYHALQGPQGERFGEAVRERFKVALIDEFQDTDPVQYSIFKELFHKRARLLLLIGDPKQAIYSFRGADIFTYMRAKEDADLQLTLGVNWRSSSGLVKAVNTIFSQGEWPPFALEGIGFSPAAPSERADETRLVLHERPTAPLVLQLLERPAGAKNTSVLSKAEAKEAVIVATASEIIALLEQGHRGEAYFEEGCGERRPLRAGDLAVLVRANKEATEMQQALQRLGVPSVVQSSESLFVTREARELQRVLRAMAEPNNDGLLRVALTTEMLGVSGEKLFQLRDSEQEWEEIQERFREFHERWSRRGFSSAMSALLSSFSVQQRLLRYNDGERRVTNLMHLGERLQEASTRRNLGVMGALKWLEARRADSSLGTEEDGLRLASDGEVVQIVTIHKSKGLEYSVVFCPFLWSRSDKLSKEKEKIQFHDPAQGERLTLDFGSEAMEENRELALAEELAEELRLMYVALTRARHRCVVCWGKIRHGDVSAPAYLFHPPLGADGQGGDPRSLLKKRVKDLSDEEIKQDLKRLIDASGGTVSFQEFPTEPPERLALESEDVQELRARPLTSSRWQTPSAWRLSSFTALSAKHSYDAIQFSQELPDHDGLDERESPKVTEESLAGIFGFPRGARAGNLFHDLFQFMDFREAEGEPFRLLVRQTLARFGFDLDVHEEVLLESYQTMVKAPLDPALAGLNLAAIGPEARLNELEFYYPIRQASPEGLKAVLHSTVSGVELVSTGLEEVEFRPFEGFMKGFIDLVFVYEGKYYLLDYKSNHLGNRAEDYNQVAMEKAMRKHNYHLQYVLYVVALHRYLKTRVPSYDYETHFGGVFYLFLRGLQDKGEGESYGVYRDRPSAALVHALSDYFAGRTS